MNKEVGDLMYVLTPEIDFPYPVIRKAQGIYLFDAEGKRYIDGTSGAVCANIGHGVTEIAEAMKGQASTVQYVLRNQFISEPALQLAERIATRWAPAGVQTAWFSSGGSEAVETAFRLARQYHVERGDAGRFKIVSTWHSYHGSTLGALAATGRTRPRAAFQPYFSGAWSHIETAYCYRCPYGLQYPACGVRCAEELEQMIIREGPENVAAFIVEPVVGVTTAGTYPPDEYFPAIRETCDRYGVLLIADEVMSGFGRTGERFACDHWGLVPDIIACGKGLGGGYSPIFATLVHTKIVDAIRSGSGEIGLGNTFGANPVSCSVGLAVLDYIERHDLVSRARKLGELLRRGLDDLKDIPIVGDVRGRGLMQGVEFVADQDSRATFPHELKVARQVAEAAIRRGLLLLERTGTANGLVGDHVFVTPPLTASEDEILEIVSIIKESISEVSEKMRVRSP